MIHLYESTVIEMIENTQIITSTILIKFEHIFQNN